MPSLGSPTELRGASVREGLVPARIADRYRSSMPGSLWALTCTSCSRVSEISTGADGCNTCGLSFTCGQNACPTCGNIQTALIGRCEHIASIDTCEACGTMLVPWAGKAGLQEPTPGQPEWDQSEVVEGPCPACGAPLTAYDVGMWD